MSNKMKLDKKNAFSFDEQAVSSPVYPRKDYTFKPKAEVPGTKKDGIIISLSDLLAAKGMEVST